MTEKKKRQFVGLLIITAALLLFYNLASRVNSYNTTLLAFSYKYGFIPRGLLGTLYQGINDLIPIELNCYSAVNVTVLIMTSAFTVFSVVFLAVMLKSIYEKNDMNSVANWHPVWGVALLFLIVTVPTFAGYYNFGRVDMYMLFVSLLGIILIVKEKALWLLIPLAAFGEMFHEAYVFMYFNLILVLQFYGILTKWEKYIQEGERQFVLKKSVQKQTVLFVVVFLVGSALFFYFRFGYEYGDKSIYESIYETAYGMTHKNYVHKDLIRAEILGVDLTQEELEYRRENLMEFPFFLLLMLPFLFVLVQYYKGIFQGISLEYENNKKLEMNEAKRLRLLVTLKYVALVVGVLTLVPLFMMKVDYGRWCFAAVVYYILTIMAVLAMGDSRAKASWCQVITKLRTTWMIGPVLLGYALLITPFTDVSIGKLCYEFFDFPNKLISMWSF